MNTLSILSQALVNAAPNRDQDFARADAMYSASFRSEPYTIASLSSIDADYAQCAIREVKMSRAAAILASQGIMQPGPSAFNQDFQDMDEEEMEAFCMDNDIDDSDDNRYYADEADYEAYCEKVQVVAETLEVNLDTLICDLCNYKGEGEGGPVPYEFAKHIPVFVSKSASAMHFGI